MPSHEAKTRLRLLMQNQRADLAAATRLRAAEQAARFALPLLEKAQGPVALYWPVRNEISPLILAEHLHERAVPLCLPVVTGSEDPLQFRAWAPGDALHKGRYGIDEPSHKAAFISPVILVLPLIAFDATGTRLGTGGGYYDRTLKAMRLANKGIKAIGFAYAFQQAGNLPHEPHDEGLDVIVTEKGVISA